MRNTKAQSDVVSTVLIILLVVAAIAIIGAIILNVVNKGGSSVNAATACQAVDIHPTACTVNASVATAIAAEGAGGSSDANVTAVNFIFGSSAGATQTNVSTAVPTSVGATTSATYGAPYNANVKTAVTLKLSDGSTTTCNPSAVQVTCN